VISRLRLLIAAVGLALAPGGLRAQPLLLPTPNRDIFQPGGEARYFVGTVGKPWTSGTFGCVRTDGYQFHEGWDIRATTHDRQGEATDAVTATADGVVAYLNSQPALSNYGRFVILRHRIEGLEIYSSYAHLSRLQPGLTAGQAVKAGQPLGTLGRSANTAQGISKDRAHLHFELGLRLSDRFTAWQKSTYPGQRNDHGEFNGRNFAGLDPFLVFREQTRLRERFSLLRVLQSQTALCRVQVRDTDFAWLRRYPQLIVSDPKATGAGVAGYEISLNYHGLPFKLVPLTAAGLKSRNRLHLVEVDAAEQKARPCGKLVARSGAGWRLTATGERLFSLLLQ
jgi:murein DD-endopeptidase MepM/ murein hydrolase activator NlpD